MENILGLALLVLLILVIVFMMLVLLALMKVKRILTRALTFVFTFSLKPRWKKYK